MEKMEKYSKLLFTRDEINFLKIKKHAKIIEDSKCYFLIQKKGK
jgi:hypothetical protein